MPGRSNPFLRKSGLAMAERLRRAAAGSAKHTQHGFSQRGGRASRAPMAQYRLRAWGLLRSRPGRGPKIAG